MVPVVVCALMVTQSTAAPARDDVVARIGDTAISREALEQAARRLRLRYGDRPIADVLQVLIDRQLMVDEARDQGLEHHRLVAEAASSAEKRLLAEAVYRAEVSAKASVSDEEVREYFHQNGLDRKREIQASHIQVESREDADEVLQLLASGEDFADLARGLSTDAATAARGGDMGVWQEEDTLRSGFVKELFALQPGAVSAPYRDAQGHFHIIKAVASTPVGFERQRQKIETHLLRQQKERLWQARREELAEQTGLSVDPGALSLLLESGRRAEDGIPPLPPGTEDRVLCTYSQGQLTLGEYRHGLEKRARSRRPAAVDSAEVRRAARELALTAKILPQFARQHGLDADSLVVAGMASKRAEALVEILRRTRVVE